MEEQGFADGMTSDPQEDQGYFLCLLGGQHGGILKKAVQQLQLSDPSLSQSQPLCVLAGIRVVKESLNL